MRPTLADMPFAQVDVDACTFLTMESARRLNELVHGGVPLEAGEVTLRLCNMMIVEVITDALNKHPSPNRRLYAGRVVFENKGQSVRLYLSPFVESVMMWVLQNTKTAGEKNESGGSAGIVS